ncbi:MAG: glycosyltransferase family 39 protein [Bacteroidales bacterium]|nr:glycosyltransferase family 39 protein [Bacteroidales bacterium]
MLKRLTDRFPVLTVILLLLLSLSPLMALRDFTPSNELRYLSIVDEALQDGHVFAFTNQGEDYADKPPLYFWLMMLCRILFGEHNMYALALLSFIPACLIIVIMDRWLRSAYPDGFRPRQRFAAALMLATTGLFLGMTVFLRMDMLMCLWIVLALWTFWKMDNGIGHTGWLRVMLPVYTFLALFTKGPVGLLVPPFSIIVFLAASRRWKDIGKYLGVVFWGILAVLCAAWFTGAFLEGGAGYLKNLLFHQTVGRAVNAFHHKEPFWYYLLMIWAVMLPWCLATVPGLIQGLVKKRGGETPSGYERMLALTGISIFVMLSLFSSKLAIYLAPLFPFAVYLWPAMIRRRGWSGWQSAALTIPAVLALILGLALAVTGFISFELPAIAEFINFPFLKSPLILLAGAILLFGGFKALHGKVKDSWERPVVIVSIAVLAAIFLISFKMPSINDYIGYANVCKLVPEEGKVYTLLVNRPESMDVYLGRDIYDFGKDTESLLFLAPEEGTLIMPLKALSESDRLGDFVENLEVQYCGPYAVYQLAPAKKARHSRRQ